MSCLHEAVNAAETGSTSTMSRVKKRTCRENPFKEDLENQGIVFPTSNQSKPSGTNTSDLYRTAPLTKSEEEEQLKMALSISARGPLESKAVDTKTPLCESHPYYTDTSEIEGLMGIGSSHSACDEQPGDDAGDTEVANLLLSLSSK